MRFLTMSYVQPAKHQNSMRICRKQQFTYRYMENNIFKSIKATLCVKHYMALFMHRHIKQIFLNAIQHTIYNHNHVYRNMYIHCYRYKKLSIKYSI